MVGWWPRVIRVIGCGTVGDPAEDLRADACKGADVSIVATIDEFQAEVDVLLLFESEAAEDE